MEYAPTSHNRTVYASPLKRIGLQPEGYAQWRLKSVGKNVYCIQICKFYFAYLCGDKQLSSMICNSKNRRAGSVPAKDGTAAPVEKIYRSFMAHIVPALPDTF
jgi:hypothetical protein